MRAVIARRKEAGMTDQHGPEKGKHEPWAGALGRIPSGLFIVTARRGEDETGMLASWVQQCSFDPPQVSLAVAHGRPVNDWLMPGEAFTVNILEEGETDMIAHFGKGFAPGQPAFEGLEVRRSGEAPPVLEEALAYLECRVVSRHTVGDHDLVIGRVLAGDVLDEGRPMIHVRKNGLHY
jgi:flavin reductase (DIM6/NTAB) family NADH-FMN oxidoreductase RutF